MSGHWDDCLARTLAYTAVLTKAVRENRMNEPAVEGLVKSHLEQPAYWPQRRSLMHREAMHEHNSAMTS